MSDRYRQVCEAQGQTASTEVTWNEHSDIVVGVPLAALVVLTGLGGSVSGPATGFSRAMRPGQARLLATALFEAAEVADTTLPCDSCGAEGTTNAECPLSTRPCGHHCNHSWSHDVCCWCDKRFNEEEVQHGES